MLPGAPAAVKQAPGPTWAKGTARSKPCNPLSRGRRVPTAPRAAPARGPGGSATLPCTHPWIRRGIQRYRVIAPNTEGTLDLERAARALREASGGGNTGLYQESPFARGSAPATAKACRWPGLRRAPSPRPIPPGSRRSDPNAESWRRLGALAWCRGRSWACTSPSGTCCPGCLTPAPGTRHRRGARGVPRTASSSRTRMESVPPRAMALVTGRQSPIPRGTQKYGDGVRNPVPDGAGGRIRTGDLPLTRRLLYR